MLSSKFVNSMFDSLATLVSRLTGKNIQFVHVKPVLLMEDAVENVDQFAKDVAEAFDDPMFKTLGVLEPGKLYCLQIDSNTVDWGYLEALANGLRDQGTWVAVIDKDMNFVSVPEGCEIVRKKEENS